MRTWVNIARYHMVRPVIYLGLPWAILTFSFLVNLAIFSQLSRHSALPSDNAAYQDTGAVGCIFVLFFIMGVSGTGQSLPFGLALGMSRRSFYAGTALLAVTLAAGDAVVLTALQAIERAANGWGGTMHFFQLPYMLDGPWYLTWLTSFVGLVLLFVYGMWFGIVYRRWGRLGTLTFLAAQVTGVVGVILTILWSHAWAIGYFLGGLSPAGMTGLLAALTALLFAGGYATVRRVTV